MNYPKSKQILCLVVFLFTFFFSEESTAQQAGVAVEFGEYIDNPVLGFNARLRAQHQLPFCEQPEPSPTELDWNNEALRATISDVKPGVLRFPGGTPANFWNWQDEVIEIVNLQNEVELLPLCEGTVIGLSNSSQIGCEGDFESLTYESMQSMYSSTTVTLASYKEAIEFFNASGNPVEELFVIGLFDPRYYVGSPQLEFERPIHSDFSKRSLMKQRGLERAIAQLDKILLEYCGSCATYGGEFSFELGNELHLKRYGKFLPALACFDSEDICQDCLPDVDYYADVCQLLIPEIRERFPNAKIALNGSRDLGGEPWNQIILERFESGFIQADAVMMHFYPKSTNPDSLNLELCQALEGSFSIDGALHYQQVFTDYLLDNRNIDIFENSDLELWFTEFNNHDFSERCVEEFGIDFVDEDHNYDSGNWIHALSVFNLFNSFSHYASTYDGPWSSQDRGLNITKLCMHILLGRERESALFSDMNLTPAGMAIGSLMNAIAETDSYSPLLITPPAAISIDAQGAWQPVDESQGLPWMYDLDYTDKHGDRQSASTWDSYGWSFHSADVDRAILVNLKGSSIDLDITNLQGFSGNTRFKTYKVPRNKLTHTLRETEESQGLFISEGLTDSGTLLMPPFSYTEVYFDYSFPSPSNDNCLNPLAIQSTLWGEDLWTSASYSGASAGSSSCSGEEADDIWFSFSPSSRDELIMIRDANSELDIAFEIYEDCASAPLLCADSYGSGSIEKGFLNDLEIGQSYLIRAYAKSYNPLDIIELQVQVKTMTNTSLIEGQCGNLGYDNQDQLIAVSPELLYQQNQDVDAYRFKFIPEDGSAVLLHKNEGPTPHILALADVEGLEGLMNYTVQIQHRIRTSANGLQVKLWSEYDEGCLIGIENNCRAFESAPVGLTKSLAPVNGVIDRLQVKWYKATPQIPYAVEDSAACDIEYWPIKDLASNTPILNGEHKILVLRAKEGQEFFKWPIKFIKPTIFPNYRYNWKVRCACEYGNGLMSPWSEVKIFNTPDYDPVTNTYTPAGGQANPDSNLKNVEVRKVEKGRFLLSARQFDLSKVQEVILFDLSGREVPISDIERMDNQIMLTIGSERPSGVYIVQVYSHYDMAQLRLKL